MSFTSPVLPILCCGPTPALQRALRFSEWDSDSDVIRTSDVEVSVGGKATNAARAISCAGGEATVLSFAGGPVGERIQTLLAEEGLNGVWVETQAETRTCQTLLHPDGTRIRELVEEAQAVTLHEWAEFFAKVEQALPFHSGLLLCGSLPADSPPEVYVTLAELAHQVGKPVGVDAKGAELLAALSQEPEFIKINRGELRDSTGKEEVWDGMNALSSQGVKHVMITDGPHPAFLQSGRKRFQFTLPEIEAVNPIGGGDTVTGVTFQQILQNDGAKAAASAGLAAGLAQTLTARPAIYHTSEASRLETAITCRKG